MPLPLQCNGTLFVKQFSEKIPKTRKLFYLHSHGRDTLWSIYLLYHNTWPNMSHILKVSSFLNLLSTGWRPMMRQLNIRKITTWPKTWSSRYSKRVQIYLWRRPSRRFPYYLWDSKGFLCQFHRHKRHCKGILETLKEIVVESLGSRNPTGQRLLLISKVKRINNLAFFEEYWIKL